MLAANRISKLQQQKRAQSAKSTRTNSNGIYKQRTGRPKSSTASSRPSVDHESSLPKTQSQEPTLQESQQRPHSAPIGYRFESKEQAVTPRYEAHSSIEDGYIKEVSRTDYSNDWDDVYSESFEEATRSQTAADASNSHVSPESLDNQRSSSTVSVRSTESSLKKPTPVFSNNKKRLASAKRRKSQSASKKRPTSGKRRESTSSQKRPARRMENKFATRVYKEEVKQAQKPNLEGSCATMIKSLWLAFVMSFLPKVMAAIGLIICMLGIILIGIGSNVEANYPEGKPIGAIMFVLGFFSVVVGFTALKLRRKWKKEMRGIATKQAREKYSANDGISNGNISIISDNVNLHETKFPPRQKSSFVVIESEDNGFTNLAAVIDNYHLPGSPVRQKRRESIEATMAQISPRHSDEQETIVMSKPTTGQNHTGNKSRSGKNVKKSKPNRESNDIPRISTLDNIPEVTITEPSPRPDPFITDHSPRSTAPTPELKNSPVTNSVVTGNTIQSSTNPRVETTKSVPSPTLTHKNFGGEVKLDTSHTQNTTSPKSPTRKALPQDPTAKDDSDSFDSDIDGILSSKQNQRNEDKESGKNNTRELYRNLGFDDGDIVPEDLD